MWVYVACMCTGMHCWLAGWRVSGQPWINKLRVYPHLFTSYSHKYMCSRRNHGDNRSTVPQKQKYHIVKQHIGQLLVYFTALLVQICITLCLPLLVIVRSWLSLESFRFYFCFFAMIKMGFIIAQLESPQADQCKLGNLTSTWFVIFMYSGTWHGLLKTHFCLEVADVFFLLVKTCEPS